jgi:DEAD/DEAH box helicase domain-containing protein
LEQHILACCKESKPTQAQIARHFSTSGDTIARQLRANSRDIDFMLIEVPSNHNIVGYFFDTCEHGTGMCYTLIKYLETAFMKAKFLVDNCPCKYGCSSCTTIQRCPDDNKALFKSVGLSLLEEIINPTQTRTINQ